MSSLVIELTRCFPRRPEEGNILSPEQLVHERSLLVRQSAPPLRAALDVASHLVDGMLPGRDHLYRGEVQAKLADVTVGELDQHLDVAIAAVLGLLDAVVELDDLEIGRAHV